MKGVKAMQGIIRESTYGALEANYLTQRVCIVGRFGATGSGLRDYRWVQHSFLFFEVKD